MTVKRLKKGKGNAQIGWRKDIKRFKGRRIIISLKGLFVTVSVKVKVKGLNI